jgi:hypothetical protein
MYVCSILNPLQESDTECGQHLEEVPLILMVTTETTPRYVFRAGPLTGGGFIYEESDSFKNSKELMGLLLSKPFFSVRAMCDAKIIIVLRIYSMSHAIQESTVSLSTSNRSFLDNEQQLVNFLAKSSSNVIREPKILFSTFPSGLSIPPKNRKVESFTVLPRRSLAPEQRSAVQNLLESLSASNVTHIIHDSLSLSLNLGLDVRQGSFSKPQQKNGTDWTPSAGIITYIRGGGRRRTLAALADQISSGNFPSNNFSESTSLDLYSAPKVFAIVCNSQSFLKWQAEFSVTDTKIMEFYKSEDFDQLSFAKIDEGCVLLIDPSAFSPESVKSAISDISDMMMSTLTIADGQTKQHGSGKRPLDQKRAQKFVANSFASRFPKSRAPIGMLRLRGILLDDSYEFKEFGGLKKVIYNVKQSLKSQWGWITVGYDGEPPKYLDPVIIERVSTFFDLQEDAKTEYGNFVPDVWRIFNEPNSGLITHLATPKTILRKITLVSIECASTNAEATFFSAMHRIRQAHTPLPVKIEDEETASVLVGADLKGVAACNLMLLLPRLGTMTKDEAITNCKEHFNKNIRGTIAQRVARLEGNDVELPDPAYVQRALQDITSLTCSICMTDPSTVLTLCGHGFCKDCREQLGNTTSNQPTLNCSVCRAQLSAYDWINIGESSSIMPTKMQVLLTTLDSVFAKRRQKRRIGLRAWIVAPDNACESIRSFLSKHRPAISLDQHSDSAITHGVRILSFQNLYDVLNQSIDDECLEAVILACPAKSEVYHKLVKACANRRHPLQLHVMHSKGLETIDNASRLFLQV